MNSQHIPDRLIEAVCSLYRKCKNAEEGTRLPKLQAEITAEHPELSSDDVLEVSRITAKLIIDQIDPADQAFVSRAAQAVLRRPENRWR